MAEFITSCPRNCYSTCSFKVHIEEGRIRRFEPVPENSATPEGVCLKGLSYIERVYSPDRILHPLKRVNDGEFTRISWEEAIDTIAENLEKLKNEYGSQSVLFYNGSGTKGLLNGVSSDFWRMYGGCTVTYGDLCWPAGLEATRLMLGDNINSDTADIANAKLIILWGKNAAETNIHQTRFIETALENGAQLIVIDPRRTQTAERAALLIQPRPGSDGAIALAVANHLIQNEQIDLSFINAHVHGFEEFKVLAAEYTPEKAAEIAEIPAEHITRLADFIANVKPVTINAGFGMQRYTNSGQSMRAIIALLAITGNFGKPGAGWLFANLQSHIFGMKDPVASFPPETDDGIIRVSISTALLGPKILESSDPPVKMIWVERGNPVTQNPETETVLKAFRSLEFRVVVDQFMTDTAKEADIVLPAKSMFEQTDVINAYWHDYIQIKQKVIDPPGEVKPETEIYRLLAQKLNMPDAEINLKLPGPTDNDIEEYLSQKLAPFPELSLEKLKQGPIPAPGRNAIAHEDLVFPTPSGKIELVSEEAKTRWGLDPLPSYTEPVESSRSNGYEHPLYMMTPNTKDRIHSQFNNLQMIRQLSPGPFVSIHPDDASSRSICGGDTVRIFNNRGSLILPAMIDMGIKPGCVSVTNGWWISEGGTVNFLSKARETDMGYGAAFHDNLVEVEKVM